MAEIVGKLPPEVLAARLNATRLEKPEVRRRVARFSKLRAKRRADAKAREAAKRQEPFNPPHRREV